MTDFDYEGTVSHGTLREQDLAPVFLGVLDDLNPTVAVYLREQYADALDALAEDEWRESVEIPRRCASWWQVNVLVEKVSVLDDDPDLSWLGE